MKIFCLDSHKNFIKANIVYSPKRSDAISLDMVVDSLSQFDKHPADYLNRNKKAFNTLLKRIIKVNKPNTSISYANFLLQLAGFKKCNKCNLIKDKEKCFYTDNARVDSKMYQCTECVAIYHKDNIERYKAIKKKYKNSILKNTPKWLTYEMLAEIDNIYAEARALSKRTGIQYDVDHIVPLKGKNISGLHVPWNLQILKHSTNVKKGNKYKCEY